MKLSFSSIQFRSWIIVAACNRDQKYFNILDDLRNLQKKQFKIPFKERAERLDNFLRWREVEIVPLLSKNACLMETNNYRSKSPRGCIILEGHRCCHHVSRIPWGWRSLGWGKAVTGEQKKNRLKGLQVGLTVVRKGSEAVLLAILGLLVFTHNLFPQRRV